MVIFSRDKDGNVRITAKRYRCKRCGHVVEQSTNHYGETWSFGRWNCCPECPPWAKYSEFGGMTVWECLDSPPPQPVPLSVYG